MVKQLEYMTTPRIKSVTIYFQDLSLEVRYNSSFKDGLETPFVAKLISYLEVKWEKLTM